jgi:cytochrome c556
VSDKPAAFRTLLGASEASAQALQDSLTAWTRAGAAGAPPASLAGAMKALNASCTACHNAFRDDPSQRVSAGTQ